MTVDTFQAEIEQALKAYDRYVVCLDKSAEDCRASLCSLMEKAIAAFEGRGPNLRHGIALDKQLTVILSQSDQDRPLCAIYFNLCTPYFRPSTTRAVGGSTTRP